MNEFVLVAAKYNIFGLFYIVVSHIYTYDRAKTLSFIDTP